MLRSHLADFGRPAAVVRLGMIGIAVLCSLLAANSYGAATPKEAQTEEPPAAGTKDQGSEGEPAQQSDGSREAEIGKLIAQLKEKQAVADEAADALVKIGRPAVALLAKALHNDNKDIREGAAEVLGDLGADAEPAIPDLAEALCSKPTADGMRDYDTFVAPSAALALAKIGRSAVPALAKALQDGNEHVRSYAVDALGRMGPAAAAAAPDLKRLVAVEKSESVRWPAVETYAAVEPDKREVVSLLTPLLRDREPHVRAETARLLGQLGPTAAPAVTALLAGLDDQGLMTHPEYDPNQGIDRPVCCDMAEALGRIGEPARVALPKLSAMMTGDRRATVRISAAVAVCQIDPSHENALRPLIRILEDDPEELRACEAAMALEGLGPRAREALPALARALRHKYSPVRHWSVCTLGAIGGAEAVPPLICALRDPDTGVRWAAVAWLGDLGAVAAPAAPALIKLLETAPYLNENDRLAIEALGNIGPAAAEAIPTLEKALKHKDPSVREAAAAALNKIRSTATGTRRPTEVVVPQTEEAVVIDRIERCGARVTVDRSPSGQSAISVVFWESWPIEAGLAQLKRLPAVQSLDLSRTGITRPDDFWFPSRFGPEPAPLSEQGLTDAGLVHLAGLTQLRSLNLSETPITDAGLAHLKGLAQLQSLDLSMTLVVGPGLECLCGMPRLRTLRLAKVPFRRMGEVAAGRFNDAQLRHLQGLADLRTLDFSETSISDAGLVHVGHLKGLQSLKLPNSIAAWRRMSIHSLSESYPEYHDAITDAGLAHLRGLHALESLDLWGRSITDAGLAHLKGLRNLRKLRLNATLVTVAGAESLKQALPEATIEIDLPEDETIAEIEDLGGKVTRDETCFAKSVIGVDLSRAGIRDDDVATAAKFVRLETLDLSETEVTDAGLAHLQGSSQLKTLRLHGAKVTDQGVKKLQQSLPNCKINR